MKTMTKEEAIQILSTRDAHGVLCGYTSGVTEALDMAIEALSRSGDLISRADAIKAVASITMSIHLSDVICDKLLALPSAEAKPTVIRSTTLMPTKDFKEWAKRVRETNPNVIVIPCDAEVVSADAVQGEWIHDGQNFKGGLDWCHCSECGCKTSANGLSMYNYCPNCGARMKGGDSKMTFVP